MKRRRRRKKGGGAAPSCSEVTVQAGAADEEEGDGWGDYDEACAVKGGCQLPDGKTNETATFFPMIFFNTVYMYI